MYAVGTASFSCVKIFNGVNCFNRNKFFNALILQP